MKSLRVGTRGSILALKQCYEILAELQTLHWQQKEELLSIFVEPIRTEGDKKQGTPESASLTKKAWIGEIESALLDNKIDIAIHSGKDVPNDIVKGTKVISVGKRNHPFDVFIGKKINGKRLSFCDVKDGGEIGTASKRRRQFVTTFNPRLQFIEHRGNVNSRLAKLDEDNSMSGIILAEAGIRRLGIEVDYEKLGLDVIVPSSNQGTLVVQYRAEDTYVEQIISLICDKVTEIEFKAEKIASTLLNADCSTCLGIYSFHLNNELNLIISAASSANVKVEYSSSMNSSYNSLEHFIGSSVDAVIKKGILEVMKA